MVAQTIKSLKLISGEELLAKVEEHDTEVKVTDPVIVAPVGEGKLALIPWLPLAEKPEATIRKMFIIHSYVPNEQLVNHYRQQTSGIQLAGANELPPTPPNFGK